MAKSAKMKGGDRVKSRITEHIKTALVAFFLLALVCLCILYMLSYRGMTAAEFSKEQMNRLDDKSVKYQYLKYMDAICTYPEWIGFSNGNASVGFVCDSEAAKSAYGDAVRFLEVLFGEGGKMSELSESEGRERFLSALFGEYIYLSYASDLPKSVIVGTAKLGAALPGLSGEFIKEIVIYPAEFAYNGTAMGAGTAFDHTDVYAFCAVARDSSGQYYLFTGKNKPSAVSDVGFHKNYYNSYTTAEGAMPYTFAAEADDLFFAAEGRKDNVTDTTVIMKNPIERERLSCIRFSPEAGVISTILRAFMMNPDKISSYTDEAGVISYFDEGRNVKFMPDGSVRYTALGASGMSLDEIFGYHTGGGAYDTLDHVGAAMILSDAFGMMEKEELAVYICDFVFDGDMLAISLGYRFRGIPLFINGKPEMMRLEVADGILRSVSLRLYEIHAMDSAVATEDPSFLLRGYLLTAKTRHALLPVYRFKDGETVLCVEFVAVSRGKEGKR